MRGEIICASLTRAEEVEKANEADLVEVRIDLLGPRWVKVIEQVKKAWIACNRSVDEGGAWSGSEERRVRELLKAVELGAFMIDLELRTKGLKELVLQLKDNGVKCIISHHILSHTPSLERLRDLVRRMIASGADVLKIATMVRRVEDNIKLLELLREFEAPGIAIGMGDLGIVSRLLSPLLGGFMTYAATSQQYKAAPGQLTLEEMKRIYKLMGVYQ